MRLKPLDWYGSQPSQFLWNCWLSHVGCQDWGDYLECWHDGRGGIKEQHMSPALCLSGAKERLVLFDNRVITGVGGGRKQGLCPKALISREVGYIFSLEELSTSGQELLSDDT